MLRQGDGEAVYGRCPTGTHHHLASRGCGHSIEIEGPTVEKWDGQVARQHGFVDIEHTVEVFGNCADCAAAGSVSPSENRLTGGAAALLGPASERWRLPEGLPAHRHRTRLPLTQRAASSRAVWVRSS